MSREIYTVRVTEDRTLQRLLVSQLLEYHLKNSVHCNEERTTRLVKGKQKSKMMKLILHRSIPTETQKDEP